MTTAQTPHAAGAGPTTEAREPTGPAPAAGERAPDGRPEARGADDRRGRPRPDVSIVLPLYNEAGHIRDELERITVAMDASEHTWEIVAVDDGSTDATLDELRDVAGDDPRIRVVQHPRNLGSGGARRTGTRLARGRVVVWTDVDMTYPNDRIPELVDALGPHDQVVGSRDKEQGTHRVFRVPAKWAIRRLAQYLVQQPIPDLNSGFRAFRRDRALRYLDRLPNGFSCVTTMTMSFLNDGLSVAYLPIEYRPREGRSKFHWYHDTRRYLLQVVRMVLSYEPLRVFMPIGLVLLVFGLGKLGYDVVTKDLRLATNTLLILFAAFQVISIGLLADLVVRVTRPREVVPDEDDPPD